MNFKIAKEIYSDVLKHIKENTSNKGKEIIYNDI